MVRPDPKWGTPDSVRFLWAIVRWAFNVVWQPDHDGEATDLSKSGVGFSKFDGV